ncbi:sulfate transporter CysZ [Psychromonas antarctica]|jgi:CysZ protein|uniref:sulfate transporter CysZ n=1 Tax=Psychromonas antarctica TaxID=67573 RepID=UPI001EE9336E|nr:sulfate transporter CysZ [Psychromonas antarctica]MCG6201726.1 sulfate transporter CysZ [Psychromonas antarctica]
MVFKNQLVKQPLSGIGYLFKGMKLLSHPKLRFFILIPFTINVVIFASAFWFLFSSIMNWIDSYIATLPDFLSWLYYILWPFLMLSILFSFSFLFSTVANFIAAPFNGLLAEKTEKLLTNQQINDDGFSELLKDLPRIFKRELQKLAYFLPRLLFCALLFFIPVFGQTVAPFIWFVFVGWMMAVQYADFPFDNHKIPFKSMKSALSKRLGKNLTFGMMVSFLTTVPFVNFIIMPIAVCGATAFWVDIYKHELINDGKQLEKE